jgi:hypothetical protein
MSGHSFPESRIINTVRKLPERRLEGRLGVTVPQRQMGVGALGAGAVRSRAGVCENWQPSLLHPRPHAGGLLQVEGRHGTGDRWADLEESWGHTAVIDIAEMGKIQNLSFLGSQGS